MKNNVSPVISLVWCRVFCTILPAFLCGFGATVVPAAMEQTSYLSTSTHVTWVILSGCLALLNEAFVGHLFYRLVRKNESLQQPNPTALHEIKIKLIAVLPFAVWVVGVYLGYYYFFEGEWHWMPAQH